MLGDKKVKGTRLAVLCLQRSLALFCGTYNYKVEAGQNMIEYAPIYPDLYTHRDVAKDKHLPIKVKCTKVTLDRNK